MGKKRKKKKEGEKSSLPWSDGKLRRMRKSTRMALVIGTVALKFPSPNPSIEL